MPKLVINTDWTTRVLHIYFCFSYYVIHKATVDTQDCQKNPLNIYNFIYLSDICNVLSNGLVCFPPFISVPVKYLNK